MGSGWSGLDLLRELSQLGAATKQASAVW